MHHILHTPNRFDWGMEAWRRLLATCFFTSLLRFARQLYALKFSSATNAGMILVLEPVWTTLRT